MYKVILRYSNKVVFDPQLKSRWQSGTARQSFLPIDIDNLLSDLFTARRADFNNESVHELSCLARPDSMKGITEAATLLADCVMGQKKVLIVGDFDADGATSTCLAIKALNALGLDNVDFIVPNRFEYGYGLTPEIVALADAILTTTHCHCRQWNQQYRRCKSRA